MSTQKHKCKVCGNQLRIKEKGFIERNDKHYDLWTCDECGHEQVMSILKMNGKHK